MTKRKMKKLTEAFGLLLTLAFILATAHWFAGRPASSSTPARPTSDNRTTYACIMAESFVEQHLKAPATAQFGPCHRSHTGTVRKSGNTYTVTSYVDAQNEFGALVRTHYTARLTNDGSKWTLVELRLD